jgi:hypothetical protein
MSIKEQEERELGPFTLEEAKEEIFRLADIATTERDLGQATRFILAGLFVALHAANIMDVATFLDNLYADTRDIHDENFRLSLDLSLASLQLSIQQLKPIVPN